MFFAEVPHFPMKDVKCPIILSAKVILLYEVCFEFLPVTPSSYMAPSMLLIGLSCFTTISCLHFVKSLVVQDFGCGGDQRRDRNLMCGVCLVDILWRSPVDRNLFRKSLLVNLVEEGWDFQVGGWPCPILWKFSLASLVRSDRAIQSY